VDAVADVGAGKPAGPVDTEIGTVIVIAPPFDEVSDALDDELLAGALAGIIAEADVQIDPRYGRWDAAAGSVVALGQP
jgi:hypothetical protein